MRVLVTGGAGYLGCHLVPQLLARGHQVRLFDRFIYGEAPIAAFKERCDIVRGDIRRLSEFPDLLDGIEGVIHLAGLPNDPSCDLDPRMAIDVNVEGFRQLVERAWEAGVRRFVLASSCSVYGTGVVEALDEQSPTNPVSTYAVSKLECEEILLPLKSAAFEPTAARPATLYGWSPRMRFDLAINQMVADAARTGQINVYGGGNQWRPFVHVQDAARAFAMLLEAPAETVSGEVFNLGADACNYRIIDLAHIVAEMINGIQINVAKDDDDLRTYNVRFDKIRDTLGFEPEWTIERGAKEVLEQVRDASVDPRADIHFSVRRLKQLLATPVAEGGEPITPQFIGLSQATLDEAEEEAVIDVMRSGWLASGSLVTEFEQEFADWIGAAHAVAVNSCTSALHLALIDAGVKAGDEVILSPITWPSTANTVVNMGAKIVLADIDPTTLNLDPRAVEDKLSIRTKAIMPVHLAGQPCDLAAFRALGETHGVAIVEDAAHALGASYGGARIGSDTRYACFSFYPIKNITTIEGGMLMTNDAACAEELRLLANTGMSAVAWKRYGPDAAASPPEVVRPGYKYNTNNVHAAMGLAQLKKLDALLAARRRLARLYREMLPEIEEIELPAVADHNAHAWHLMIVRLRLDMLKKSRDEIAAMLRQENIGTGVHFIGLHTHEYYRKALGVTEEELPHASTASREILSLPLFPKMNDKTVHDVVEGLKKVLRVSR